MRFQKTCSVKKLGAVIFERTITRFFDIYIFKVYHHGDRLVITVHFYENNQLVDYKRFNCFDFDKDYKKIINVLFNTLIS